MRKTYANYPQYESRKEEVIEWLMNDGQNYCALPYTHMAIESNGAIKPCCQGTPFKNVNIKNKTISEVLQSPERQIFIDTFDRKLKSSHCKSCWNDPGKHNMRISASTSFDTIQTTIDAMEGKPSGRERSLKWLEIKPGNRCNLKCRICGVHNSSQWTKEAYEYEKSQNKSYAEFKNSKEFEYTMNCDWVDDKNFWKDVTSLDEVQKIHFMGGEPFMVPEHFTMLEKMIEHKKIDNNNIVIRYNTNGTYFPTLEQIKIWKQFNRVIISISIDDVNERFEYQRSLASWVDVKTNLIKYKKLSKEMKSNWFYATLDPCVSIFNVWWVDEIEKEFSSLGYTFEFPHRHFASSGSYDARILPEQIKQHLIKKYKNKSPWQHSVAEFLESKSPYDDTAINETLEKIKFFDSMRKENFKQINNTLYNEIRKHSNGTIT